MIEQQPEPTAEEKTAPRGTTSRFARFHSQTFEMELLVSGAVTFALLQVSQWLGGQIERAVTYLDGNLRMFVTYGFVYVSLAVAALLVFFAGNLLLRAFWIGLVGLESVFPGGVDWDRLKVGRHTREQLRAHTPALSTTIERLDDVCSLAFSLAFTIVLTFVYSIVALGALLTVAWGVTRVTGGSLDRTFGLLLMAFFVFTVVVPLLDRFGGHRLVPGSRFDRILAHLVRGTLAISPLRLVGATSLVLQSRLTEKRSNLLILGSMLLVAGGFLFSLFLREGLIGLTSTVYLPRDAGVAGFDAKSYRSNWSVDDFGEANWRPSIDTDLVTEPYLRFFLPYRPFSHNARIAASCPELAPLRPDGLSFGRPGDPPSPEVLARSVECFVGLFRIELDGQPLASARFDWFTEPTHRIPGALAYLDVRELPPGRHELRIDAPRGMPPKKPGDEDERRTVTIPFWR